MKRVMSIAVGLLLSTVVLAGFSATADVKIGIVDFSKVLQQSKTLQAKKDQFKTQAQQGEGKLKELQASLKTKLDQLKKDGPVMKAEDKKKLQEDMIKGQQQLMQMSQTYGAQVMQAQQEFVKESMAVVNGVIEKIAKAKGLTIVMPKEMVVYAQPQLDITDAVVAGLDK